MSTCKDCRHWNSKGWDNRGGRICLAIGTTVNGEALAHVNKYIEDEPRHYLITMPDFGCAMFEPNRGE